MGEARVSQGLFASGATVCVVLFVLFLGGVITLAVVSARKERERKEGLAGWAHANGWTYLTKPDSTWPARLPGHNRRGVTLALSGAVNGHTVSVGEYYYTTTSSNSDGSSSTTYHYYVVVGMRLPRPYPALAVYRRGALSKLGRSLFGEGRTTTGNPAFDEQFKVSTKQPEVVPAMVGPSLILAHLAGQVPTWSVVGDELMTWFEGRISDPTSIPGWAASLVLVATLLGR